MTAADTAFTRASLSARHGQVCRHVLALTGMWFTRRDAWEAAGVTCSKIAGRKFFTVQIVWPGLDRFEWHDRAHNAYEARDKAWAAWMRKQGADQ